MTPSELVGLAILVGGGILFALAAVYAVKSAARLALAAPEQDRRLAALEGLMPILEERTQEALEVSSKARRIANSRADRAARRAPKSEAAELQAADHAPTSVPVAASPFDALREQLRLRGAARAALPPLAQPLEITDIQDE